MNAAAFFGGAAQYDAAQYIAVPTIPAGQSCRDFGHGLHFPRISFAGLFFPHGADAFEGGRSTPTRRTVG